jgi:hypothetical protein
MKPDKVNILGVEYKIIYCDKPSDVDIFKRNSLWGQLDCWTRTIRIYDSDRPAEDIWQCIFHEVLHGISELLHLQCLGDENNHEELDLLALALADVLFRNEWMKP